MTRLRRKGKIASVTLGVGHSAPIGFMLSDLDEFILKARVGRYIWDEDSPELPIKVTCKLLNLSMDGYRGACSTGRLKDRTPKTIRAYIETQVEARAQQTIRKKYDGEINRLTSKIHHLRQKAIPKAGTPPPEMPS